MGDGTTLTVQDGPAVTGYYNYDAASINGDGFTFSGTTTFGTGVNLTTQYGKNIKFTGVLTAVSGFSISGADSEYTYYTLAGTENQIGGTIAITRNSTSLGINASGSLGTAAVTTSSGNQYLTYYGTAGEAADVIDNSITGAGNFVASQAGYTFPRTWRLREPTPSTPAPCFPRPATLMPSLRGAGWMRAPEP